MVTAAAAEAAVAEAAATTAARAVATRAAVAAWKEGEARAAAEERGEEGVVWEARAADE